MRGHPPFTFGVRPGGKDMNVAGILLIFVTLFAASDLRKDIWGGNKILADNHLVGFCIFNLGPGLNYIKSRLIEDSVWGRCRGFFHLSMRIRPGSNTSSLSTKGYGNDSAM